MEGSRAALQEGRIRAIGVTSFSSERLQDLFLHNEVKPAVNQLETHPFFQQKAANTFLRQEGIQHEAWAPFAEGQNDIWNNPVLKAIAARHGKTVGNVVLRWLNQRNVVVIPKTVRRERMIENLNIFDFTLTEEEMRAIAGLDTGRSPIYEPVYVWPRVAAAVQAASWRMAPMAVIRLMPRRGT